MAYDKGLTEVLVLGLNVATRTIHHVYSSCCQVYRVVLVLTHEIWRSALPHIHRVVLAPRVFVLVVSAQFTRSVFLFLTRLRRIHFCKAGWRLAIYRCSCCDAVEVFVALAVAALLSVHLLRVVAVVRDTL